MDSTLVRSQLKKSLRGVQIFIIFGTVIIILFLLFVPIIEAKHGPVLGILAVRIPLYGIFLLYLIWYYLYRSILDIRKIDRFFIEMQRNGTECTGTLISNKTAHANETGSIEAIFISGTKYICRVYKDNNKRYYYPTEILKKGVKIV